MNRTVVITTLLILVCVSSAFAQPLKKTPGPNGASSSTSVICMLEPSGSQGPLKFATFDTTNFTASEMQNLNDALANGYRLEVELVWHRFAVARKNVKSCLRTETKLHNASDHTLAWSGQLPMCAEGDPLTIANVQIAGDQQDFIEIPQGMAPEDILIRAEITATITCWQTGLYDHGSAYGYPASATIHVVK